ncbi:TetR/AcrR family transcriptional regulator [Flavobacteriaceae bacterium S356]|uniref:TetR/AcrR family transcriptional regulator n=1 Tax=Asprobacillus argus TaxID=3076534 RepID=A0ABU3LI79_9FLAO|nr:TetR/AcrR family transcriptional regulator [Flavobacteriaceae bacterium S356]
MATKKSTSKNDIISWYMEHVLEKSQQPASVFSFAKENDFPESDFYKYFASFEALEKGVFKAFFDNTISVLDTSEEYQNFDARNKLLMFYFTFFENLTANRSYVVHVLGSKKDLRSLKALSELRKSYVHYINHLPIETVELKQEQLEKIQKKSMQESAWIQLLITLKFWLDDISPSFEKTDIFIEKSINTGFDIIDVAPLKSIIDLGKFLFKEKVQL